LAAIRKLRGIHRSKSGESSVGESWGAIRAEDRAIEEKHEAMLMGIGRKRTAVSRKYGSR